MTIRVQKVNLLNIVASCDSEDDTHCVDEIYEILGVDTYRRNFHVELCKYHLVELFNAINEKV